MRVRASSHLGVLLRRPAAPHASHGNRSYTQFFPKNSQAFPGGTRQFIPDAPNQVYPSTRRAWGAFRAQVAPYARYLHRKADGSGWELLRLDECKARCARQPSGDLS